MRDSRGTKLFTVCSCFMVAALMMVATFVEHSDLQDETIAAETNVSQGETISTIGTIGDIPVETIGGTLESERYQNGERVDTTVYFTNTEELDTGLVLPATAQSKLVEEAETYLRSQGIMADEIQVISDSIEKNYNITQFECAMPEEPDKILTIIYDDVLDIYAFTTDRKE